jgi:hypothetical protein
MAETYEIHRYQNDTFQYIVASTNRYTEEQVRKDVESFNTMLSNEMKSQGIRYVFVKQFNYKPMNKAHTKHKQEEEQKKTLLTAEQK